MTAALMQATGLTHNYGNGKAVDDISFDVTEGQFVTLVGPSGCGKTTTLKIVAGLLTPTEGAIHINGRDVTRQPAKKRPSSLVFQSLALFPHMTVEQNLRYPLDNRRDAPDDKAESIRGMLSLVGLDHSLLHRHPSQLSGGQKQRVALARSLIYDPKLLLLDEPLSAIDFQLRRQLRKTLSDLHRKSGKTFLYVTHSLEEALSLSDEIIVMNAGKILQRGSPDEIFSSPVSRFVAEFMGDANVFSVARRDEGGEARSDATRRFWAEELDMEVDVRRHGDLRDGYLIVRAHEVQVGRDRPRRNAMEVEIFNRYDLGGSIEYSLVRPGSDIRLSCVMEKGQAEEFSPGERVYAQWPEHAGTVVPE